MKNFAKKFIVENSILKEYNTTRGRKKPCEFSFWLESQSLCDLLKNYVEKFIVGNSILIKRATTR